MTPRRKLLTRISHPPTAAGADLPGPCIYSHLRALASRAGEKCGLGFFVWLAVAAVCAGPDPTHAEPWHYTIDQPKINQQANFCLEKTEALLVAEVFRRFGPRPGYAALSQSPACITRVASFTPKAVVDRVIISENEPGEYIVSFVRVLTDDGNVHYLVTTRDVRD